MKFRLKAPFKPTGDQPQAIKTLTDELNNDRKSQVLLGVTGSGKTFTIANLIQNTQKPTLIISHNKTLAGQLYQEFRDFFPDNAVSYFVSYYDYYQPEAYIPTTDTYIEKATSINEEIDKLRLLTTMNLMTRNDAIVIASVSSIYNIGSPDQYGNFVLTLNIEKTYPRKKLLLDLTKLQYERVNIDLKRGSFWVRGDSIEIWPSYTDKILRLEFFDNLLEKLYWLDPVNKNYTQAEQISEYNLYPAKHFIADATRESVFIQIENDLNLRLQELKNNGKELEAHRLDQKVHHDLDMMRELGYVNGIENYSRYFDGRKPGEPPYSLLEYFAIKKDWLLVIDESHITIPQIRGMYNGDQARKKTLINYGFRLPSALDNRPLRFDEFMQKTPQTIFASATPSDWELERHKVKVVEQLIRPTGLIDPDIEIRPSDKQMQNLAIEIVKRKQKGERVLVTTLTKRLAEALTDFLNDPKQITELLEDKNIELPKVAYLHSDVDTLDRQDILDDLRSGIYDVLIGINLLREGLDLPEVSLVAILDADKEGFLRSRTSLIQTMGRAARHEQGHVIMYADKITNSMQTAIEEVNRRRKIQLRYNKKHNIIPKTIQKEIRKKLIKRIKEKNKHSRPKVIIDIKTNNLEITELKYDDFTPQMRIQIIKKLRRMMHQVARDLEFEKAAMIRDKILEFED